MLRKLVFAATLFAAAPMQAQTLAQVNAKVDTLKAVIGGYTKVIPCSELDANRPALVLGDGGYPERFRLKQIGCAIDAAVSLVASFSLRVAALEARVDALAAAPTSSGGGGVLGNVVTGDLMVTGRICISPNATCAPDTQAQIQILGNENASIQFVSNLNGGQWQTPAAHWSVFSLSGDGGLRLLHNARLSTSTYTATDPTENITYQSSLRKWIEPNKPYGEYGPDSQGQYSWLIEKPGSDHEYTQDLVLRTYEDQKVLTLESWRPGWTIKLGTSTGFRTIDKWYNLTVTPTGTAQADSLRAAAKKP